MIALYIDPPSHHFLGDRLFDPGGARYGGDDLLAPHRAVRDYFVGRGVAVHTADALVDQPVGGARAVYVSLGHLDLYRRLSARPDVVASGFFAFECPIVEPSLYRSLPDVARAFKRVFSWAGPGALTRFTREPVTTERFWWPQSFDRPHETLWSRGDRRFLTMINTNKLPRLYWQELYTKRLEAVVCFQEFGEIDLYGRHWDRMPVRVGKTWVPATARRLQEWTWKKWHGRFPHPIYSVVAAASRGPVDSKSETLSQYTFAICFENMVLEGWITEKIFDCLFTGTVPVYWGAPDVEAWIPVECFIDMRRFSGFTELRDHLHSLSRAAIDDYREAARAFLASEAFGRFSTKAYVDLFRQMVEVDTGWTGIEAAART
jgi:hypothetical protein